MVMELPRTSTWPQCTTKTMGKVILELNEELTVMAFHVPTPNMSLVDLSCCKIKLIKRMISRRW